MWIWQQVELGSRLRCDCHLLNFMRRIALAEQLDTFLSKDSTNYLPSYRTLHLTSLLLQAACGPLGVDIEQNGLTKTTSYIHCADQVELEDAG